jgi:glycosyltransferase involved in cell wall biosynthesis
MREKSAQRTLLFVTDVCPYPMDRGQRVRVHHLLAACSQATDVTFVGPAPEHRGDREQLERHCVEALYLEENKARGLACLWLAARTAAVGLGLPKPSTIRKYAPFVAALNRLGSRRFDFVWAERLHIARLCPNAPGRTILDLDDLEHVKLARALKLSRSAAPLARDLYRYALYRRQEISSSQRFLASVVCSDEDRVYLSDRGCENVVTIPNGVDIPAQGRATGKRESSSPLHVAFLGHMGYAPNIDAVEFFAREVLPLIHEQRPEATFDVIGPGASAALTERLGTRVHFTGFVDDLAAAFALHDVFVAPVRVGSGTRLKILDAMARGIPVVTTKVGAEGLSLIHGEHAWFAESPSEIAGAVVRIKEDPSLAEHLASNAQSLARSRYSWDAIQDSLAEWIQTLAPSGAYA